MGSDCVLPLNVQQRDTQADMRLLLAKIKTGFLTTRLTFLDSVKYGLIQQNGSNCPDLKPEASDQSTSGSNISGIVREALFCSLGVF